MVNFLLSISLLAVLLHLLTALMMQLGCDGIFVGSGIFQSGDPVKRAKAIVQATANYNNPEILAKISEDLGEPMSGLEISQIPDEQRMADRGQ